MIYPKVVRAMNWLFGVLILTTGLVAGYCLGKASDAAKVRVLASESRLIQAAVDKLEATSGIGDEKLEELSRNPALSERVVAALQGNNPELNPSNYVFV